MHTNVHCSTVYNSKDLEPTQMPIDDRLDWENVAHIHHGILCSIKNYEFVSFVGTLVNLENIILSNLTKEQKMKYHMFPLIGGLWTMRTHGHREGSTTHWGLLGGIGEGKQGELGRDSMGRNFRCGWRGRRQQITLPRVYLCNYLACSAHVPQNLKCNKKCY